MSNQRQDKPPITIRVRRPRRPEADAPPAASDAAEKDAAETPHAGTSYKVGYKRPPLHSQFQPGRSGNPKGRPRGSKNWSTVIAEAAKRRRTIGVGGEKVRMTGLEAVAEQMVISAIKGDPRARRDFLNEMRLDRQNGLPAEEAPCATAEPLSASDEALLADFFRRAGKAFAGEDGT